MVGLLRQCLLSSSLGGKLHVLVLVILHFHFTSLNRLL